MDKFVGKRLDGRYEIREIVGVGGMAVVYKAYDSIEDRIVAIKILKDEFASNEEFQRRFKNESKAVAVLSHPNIVKVFDVSFGDLIQYIVMEYIEGVTLKEFIEHNGSLAWNEAVNFTIQILRGLQHAHDKGIVHRDIKPQNIIVLPDKTIKVTDFGIARFARKESQTITDKAIGSVHYISPEQAKGEPTDEKADIYSLGVILYEMLTGALPFEAESAVSVAIMQLQTEPKLPTHINPLIPMGLEQITMKAMQKEAKNRYKSAAEMLRDLETFKRDPSTVFHSTYFVDDAPTKAVDNFYYDSVNEPTDTNDTKEPAKLPIVPILTGVAVAFVVAIIILAIYFIPKLFGSSGEEFDCPDFLGMTKEQLEEYKDKYDFQFVIEYGSPTEENALEYEKDEIYRQNPSADEKVKNGATITVYINDGDFDAVKIPNVIGNEATKAQAVLENAGFTVLKVDENSEDVPEGIVIRTDPAAESNLPKGTTVKMFVSIGMPTEYAVIPDVTKHSLEDAKLLIERAGFTVGTVSEVNSTSNMKGYIVAQSPSGSEGQKAGKGTAINLSVGNGITVYEFKLSVLLPKDYASRYGYVSAWIDNKQVSKDTQKMDILNSESINFDISTENTYVEVTIKLSPDNNTYHDYMTYTVDATTGSIRNQYYHDYPIKDSEDSNNTNPSGNSSVNG